MHGWYERQKYEQQKFKSFYCDECGKLIQEVYELKHNDILCKECYEKEKNE